MNKYRFRDSDALALDPARGRHEASGQTRTHLLSHVSKHKKRDKALEIVFDPKAHKDYVTGFRKRKQQRRKDALKSLEKKQHQQRLEERAERRQAVRAQIELHDNEAERSHQTNRTEDQNDEAAPQVQVFQSTELTSTVTVEPINKISEEDNDILYGNNIANQTMSTLEDKESQEPLNDRGDDAWQQEMHAVDSKKGMKLSKKTLRIMQKTKLKIEGKKSRSGPNSSSKQKKSGEKSGSRKGKRRRK